MALVLKDRVKETSASTGTGDFVLAGAADGFQSFTDALADGDTTYYAIEDGTDWETGLGTWTESTSTLARTTVYESSNSGNAVDWGAGTKNVFITQPASRVATTTVYASVDDLPLSGNVQAGDQAFVTGNNRLYLFNGSGWYNIALLNLTPTIDTQPDANYGFDTYGTALTVTLTATDPEGFPLTWSANTTGMTGLATLSQNNNAFTFTPSTDAADQGQSFTATFSVTDGINTAVSNQTTFTIGIDQLAEPSVGTLTITSPTGEAVFISGLSELWKNASLSIGTSATNGIANSTFIDRSTNAHTVTPTGSPAQTAFHPYLDNWSVEFDGSSLVDANGPTADFAFGTGDFTIEAWAKFNNTASANETVIEINDNDTNVAASRIIFGRTSTGYARLYTAGTELVGTVTHMNAGEWYHIAYVRSSGVGKVYVNGILEVTHASDTNNFANEDVGAYIGSNRDNNEKTTGYVSNLRVVKGTAIYTGAFTPPTEKLTAVSGTTLLACQSNRFIDNSTNAHAITVTGDPAISAFNPFGQESEYAVGENKGSIAFDTNQVQATGPIIDVGTGDFTIEFWGYGIPYGGAVVDTRIATGNTTGALIQSHTTGYRYQSSTSLTSASGLIPSIKQWLHFAAVRNSGTVTIYHNGVGEQVATGDTTNFTQTTVTVGANSNLDFDVTEGYCSDLRITKSAVYTTDFTPPTAPVGNTNASLYLPMDNAGIFDKTGNSTFVLAGDTTISTGQTKFADTSIYFDGLNNDFIEANDANNFNLADHDWTIEAWIRPDNTSGPKCIVGYNQVDGNTFWDLRLDGSNLSFRYRIAGAEPTCKGGAIVATQWTHVAACRNNGTVTLFVNGSSVTSASVPATTLPTSVASIGRNKYGAGYDWYVGYIENLQILKGVAKYTANFTVPDREQGRTYQAES